VTQDVEKPVHQLARSPFFLAKPIKAQVSNLIVGIIARQNRMMRF
jgi:hypothetical protein